MIDFLSDWQLANVTHVALGAFALFLAFLLWRAVTKIFRALRSGLSGKRAVLDGSNILYWRNSTPQIDTVRQVVRHLGKRGYRLEVFFDANAGYLISGRYLRNTELAKLLHLPPKQVTVAPKGMPADPLILARARDLKAPVVSNDRFRDWQADFPETRQPGTLVRGRYRSGSLFLTLD